MTTPTQPEPLVPTEPWAAVEAAALAQPEFQVLAEVTQAVAARLLRLWVLLFGSVRRIPQALAQPEDDEPEPESERPASLLDTFRRYTRFALVTAPGRAGIPRGPRVPLLGPAPDIDFPPEWTDAVDDGIAEIIDAMDAAADSVRREVPAANVERVKAYRRARVRAALAPSAVAKRGFAAVTEALAQPANLESDVRGVVVGELVADHTDRMRDRAVELGDEWVTIWVAERDACVRCLAYQGLWVTPATAQLFPGGRTWGPRWKSVIGRPDFRGPGWRETESGEHEGSHPHCRCELRVVRRTNVHLLAQTLKREATRSAAKGWARPTEGDTARVAAAKHALGSAIVLPKSVTDEARRRLGKPGEFARRVPSPNR